MRRGVLVGLVSIGYFVPAVSDGQVLADTAAPAVQLFDNALLDSMRHAGEIKMQDEAWRMIDMDFNRTAGRLATWRSESSSSPVAGELPALMAAVHQQTSKDMSAF